MKMKPNVTIGIPAYNEEANIGILLEKLLSQKEFGFYLKEIIVVSDGSSDKTDRTILSFANPKIVFVKNLRRIGQQRAQNTILNKATGDIVVIIEADVLPQSTTTIAKLIEPFSDNSKNLGMVVGNAEIFPPKANFEKILCEGYNFRHKLFEKWKSGNNVYLATGQSMKALSSKFAKSLVWPDNVPEDSYVYLRCKELGFKVFRNPDAKSVMRNCTNFADRLKQCKKYQTGRHALEKYFSKEYVKREYKLPLATSIKYIIKEYLKNPFWLSLYFLEMLSNRIYTLFHRKYNHLYEPYYSSKKFNILNI